MNKKKIINDPVYGFVTIPSELIFDLVSHPYFQRLRYIKQVSMTHMVYPGALHTRFHHALGAMHLMSLAVETLKGKGIPISEAEEEGVLVAILLHDIGHGPFSHSLERSLVEDLSHERISELLMYALDKEFNGKLSLAIEIFQNRHPKHYLHQLVSSQLDTDRMDYLNRDSFYTGVSEGVISFDRILKMLNVVDNELVVEEKGIYSIEKFLIARRLMYWQVYLHKTVISAEFMLVKVLERAKVLSMNGEKLFATPALAYFLTQHIDAESFENDPLHLKLFMELDDTDILSAIKVWATNEDKVLQLLCSNILKRHLNRVEVAGKMPEDQLVATLKKKTMATFNLNEQEVNYLVYRATISNSAYDIGVESIRILMKDGRVQDITQASDLANLETLSKKVQKYIISYPKEILMQSVLTDS